MDGTTILHLGETGTVLIGLITVYYKIGKVEGKVEMICRKLDQLNRRGKK